MAFLIGGIGSSHAPSIAHAADSGLQQQPEWMSFFDAYQPVRAWLHQCQVDTLVVFYNDHLNHFQFDAYPTFGLGVADAMPVCDEGSGARDFPLVPGDPELGWYLAQQLVQDGFDPTICQQMALDHGVMSVLPLLVDTPWTVRVVPIHINVLREPLPTPERCWRLGVAAGRAIASCPAPSRVAVVSTGGLSHQLHGPDFGFTNPSWDNRFMDLLIHQPDVLRRASHEDFMCRGGAESVEMMIWLAMRGALSTSGGGAARSPAVLLGAHAHRLRAVGTCVEIHLKR